MEQDEFEKALAAQVAKNEPEEQPEEPEAETPEEPEEEPEAEAEEEPEAEDEPEPEYPEDVRSFLDKYQGDIGKALQAAVHAQAKLGEQGNELGKLRQMVEEIRDRPEPKAPTSPFVPPEISDAIADNPQGVVQWAIENENGQVYEAAMAEWYDMDARAASRFERAMERELLKQELQGEIQPDIEAVREQQKARAVADAHRSLSQKYPDFQQTLENATEAELAGIDRNLLATAQQTNPQAALELVYRWVRAGREEQAAQKAERTEQGRKAKREAAVVTGDTTNNTETTTVMDKLKAAMLEPEPQSVYHGLTVEE